MFGEQQNNGTGKSLHTFHAPFFLSNGNKDHMAFYYQIRNSLTQTTIVCNAIWMHTRAHDDTNCPDITINIRKLNKHSVRQSINCYQISQKRKMLMMVGIWRSNNNAYWCPLPDSSSRLDGRSIFLLHGNNLSSMDVLPFNVQFINRWDSIWLKCNSQIEFQSFACFEGKLEYTKCFEQRTADF